MVVVHSARQEILDHIKNLEKMIAEDQVQFENTYGVSNYYDTGLDFAVMVKKLGDFSDPIVQNGIVLMLKDAAELGRLKQTVEGLKVKYKVTA